MRDEKQPCGGADQRAKGFRRPRRIAGHDLRHVIGHDAVLTQPFQRTQHRVMLERGNDHVVALLEHALQRKIDRVGAVGSKDRPFRLRAEERRQRFARKINLFSRFCGKRVTGAARIRRKAPQTLLHGKADTVRLRERRGGVVKIDHGVSADPDKKP